MRIEKFDGETNDCDDCGSDPGKEKLKTYKIIFGGNEDDDERNFDFDDDVLLCEKCVNKWFIEFAKIVLPISLDDMQAHEFQDLKSEPLDGEKMAMLNYATLRHLIRGYDIGRLEVHDKDNVFCITPDGIKYASGKHWRYFGRLIDLSKGGDIHG